MKTIASQCSVFMIMALFLVSCQMNQIRDPVLQGSSCAPPCWYQIRPGVSTVEDVKAALVAIPSLDQNTIRWDDQPSSLTPRVQAYLQNESLVLIYFLDKKVVCIDIFGPVGYTFGQATAILGEPEFVTAVREAGTGQAWYSPFKGSADSISLKAIRKDDGIAYGYYLSIRPRDLVSKMQSEIELSRIIFFDPAHFDELAERGYYFLTSNFNLKDTMAAMTPWVGYKEIGTDYPYAQRVEDK